MNRMLHVVPTGVRRRREERDRVGFLRIGLEPGTARLEIGKLARNGRRQRVSAFVNAQHIRQGEQADFRELSSSRRSGLHLLSVGVMTMNGSAVFDARVKIALVSLSAGASRGRQGNDIRHAGESKPMRLTQGRPGTSAWAGCSNMASVMAAQRVDRFSSYTCEIRLGNRYGVTAGRIAATHSDYVSVAVIDDLVVARALRFARTWIACGEILKRSEEYLGGFVVIASQVLPFGRNASRADESLARRPETHQVHSAPALWVMAPSIPSVSCSICQSHEDVSANSTCPSSANPRFRNHGSVRSQSVSR